MVFLFKLKSKEIVLESIILHICIYTHIHAHDIKNANLTSEALVKKNNVNLPASISALTFYASIIKQKFLMFKLCL